LPPSSQQRTRRTIRSGEELVSEDIEIGDSKKNKNILNNSNEELSVERFDKLTVDLKVRMIRLEVKKR